MRADRILIVGSGGRELSIAEALTASHIGHGYVKEVFIAPGNAGTEFLKVNEKQRILNVELPHEEVEDVVDVVRKNDIGMVVVGPEAWLEKELGDVLAEEKIPAIAPPKDRAVLELDKVYTRLKGWEWGVPQPQFAYFSDVMEAIGFVKGHNLQEGVVKVRGLAAGKGVTVCETQNELIEATVLARSKFGSAADQILIEERLYGQEVSYIGVCDGETFLPFTPAMDFKFLNGRTTGGMAAIAPNPYVNSWMAKNIEAKIVKPVVEGMRSDGVPYKGILYFGVMLTKDGPKLIEINTRHGDPETQVQLPFLKYDLNSIYHSVITGSLKSVYGESGINYGSQEAAAAIIVLAANGYPHLAKKGDEIYGLKNPLPQETTIYHSGTKKKGENIITNGGRVLGVTTIIKGLTEMTKGDMMRRAIEKSYSVIGKEKNGIYFDGMQFLDNIGDSQLTEKANDAYASAGVNYGPVDHLKRMASEFAQTTNDVAKHFGFDVIPDSRGETAFLINMNHFIGAFVQEGLGTKNLIKIKDGNKIPGPMSTSKEGSIDSPMPQSQWEALSWDTVACIVNDLAAVGAQPVVICPHWAAGNSDCFNNEDQNKGLYMGWLKACNAVGAVYGPGETSILTGVVNANSLEMSGSGFGVIMAPSKEVLGKSLSAGNHIVVIASNGIHTNGLSYARKIASEMLPNGYNELLPSGIPFGEVLLKPTHMYSSLTRKLFEEGADIRYMVNITGHGWRKMMRAANPFTYRIHSLPKVPEEFKFMQVAADLSDYSAFSMWNMGGGYAYMVPQDDVSGVISVSKALGFDALDIGIVEEGKKKVIIEPLKIEFYEEDLQI